MKVSLISSASILIASVAAEEHYALRLRATGTVSLSSISYLYDSFL